MKNLLLLFLPLLSAAQAIAGQPLKDHPEKGKLPFNAPCSNCTEDIDHRTANTRDFFSLNADGSKTIYHQQSYGAMNYMDADGFWRTIDPRPVAEGADVFAARHQPYPVVIDFQNRFASIENGSHELRFNKNISLVYKGKDGSETSMGTADWSHVSKTEHFAETIFLVKDFYPGLDLQMVAGYGRIKTNIILNQKLQLGNGWLVMRQQLSIPEGLHADLSGTLFFNENMRTGSFSISDPDNTEYFRFMKSNAHDFSSVNYMEMPFVLDGNSLYYFVPAGWLNEPALQYPVTLDPLVMSSDTLPEANITGSGYTAVCGTQGCSYFMNNVMTPANCEITNIETYFSYLANLPCIRDDGGFDITMTSSIDTCTSRNFTCLGGIQGACFFWPAQLLFAVPPLFPCLPAPQCASYPLSFELKFRRCNWVPIVPCDASCILANSDWIITIVGSTVELVNSSAASQTICEGECALLTAQADSGVGPYTFQWMPGNLTGSSVQVCPATTTQYTLVASDACGSTDTGYAVVTVVPYQNPGFSIAPTDTVCDGTMMSFTGNGSAAATSYDWTINCSGPLDFNNTQNLNYLASTPGNCLATLNFQVVSGNHVCAFDSTLSFVVDNCSGITEQEADLVLSIYPNPSHEIITIQLREGSHSTGIQLSSALGQQIFQEKNIAGDKILLDTTSLTEGIYFIKVTQGSHSSIHKIVLY